MPHLLLTAFVMLLSMNAVSAVKCYACTSSDRTPCSTNECDAPLACHKVASARVFHLHEEQPLLGGDYVEHYSCSTVESGVARSALPMCTTEDDIEVCTCTEDHCFVTAGGTRGGTRAAIAICSLAVILS